jgi:sporulation protein YlmC with PRC-barrel domain
VDTYVILRRGGWRTADDLKEAAARSTAEGEKMGEEDIRWIRSYVLQEEDGSVGTVCIYQASGEDAIRKHADGADLPVDEVIKVGDTVFVRPDPTPAAA